MATSQSQSEIRQALLSHALRLLSLRPRFSGELVSRLQEKAIKLKFPDSDDLINQIISDLTKDGFIDDESNLKNYLHHQLFDRTRGPYYLRVKLKNLRVPALVINQGFKDHLSNIDQLNVLKNYLNRNLRNFGQKSKARLYRRLLGRGFPSDLILQAMASLNREFDA